MGLNGSHGDKAADWVMTSRGDCAPIDGRGEQTTGLPHRPGPVVYFPATAHPLPSGRASAPARYPPVRRQSQPPRGAPMPGHSGAQLFLERERFKFQQLQQQREFQQQQQQLMLQMFGRVLQNMPH
jgi:hypothetical protein